MDTCYHCGHKKRKGWERAHTEFCFHCGKSSCAKCHYKQKCYSCLEKDTIMTERMRVRKEEEEITKRREKNKKCLNCGKRWSFNQKGEYFCENCGFFIHEDQHSDGTLKCGQIISPRDKFKAGLIFNFHKVPRTDQEEAAFMATNEKVLDEQEKHTCPACKEFSLNNG